MTADGLFSYEAEGDPAAPAIVFLHGIGGAARAWRRQLGALAGDYRAIAWDMPGYGQSKPLAETTIATLAGALHGFIATLKLDRPVLVGHSIGGMIVQHYCAEYPDAARAVVLAQTSPAFGRPDGDWQRAFVATRLDPLDRGQTMATLAPGIVTELVGDDPDPAGLEVARDCMASVPDATYRAVVRALVGFDQRAALPRLTMPALVLAGERDGNAPHDMMRKMAEKIPAAEYVCLPGTGHLANLERPAEVDAILADFLRRHVPTGEGARR